MNDLSSLSIGLGSSWHAPDRTVLDLTLAEPRSTLTISEGEPVHGTVQLAYATGLVDVLGIA